jgi:hypothetical protein
MLLHVTCIVLNQYVFREKNVQILCYGLTLVQNTSKSCKCTMDLHVAQYFWIQILRINYCAFFMSMAAITFSFILSYIN